MKHNCKSELRNANLKATPARLGILAALEKADLPLDIKDLIVHLQNQQIKADRVTVFRIINTFTEKGLVKPIQFNDGKLRHELVDEAKHHHHIVCSGCGAVEDIKLSGEENMLQEAIEKTTFKIDEHSLEFFGWCGNCQ